MPRPGQRSLFHRSRFVGLRFSDAEYQRLEAANAERTKGWAAYLLKGNGASLSHFIREQLKPLLTPPAPQKVVKQNDGRSKKVVKQKGGRGEARRRRSGRSIPKKRRARR